VKINRISLFLLHLLKDLLIKEKQINSSKKEDRMLLNLISYWQETFAKI